MHLSVSRMKSPPRLSPVLGSIAAAVFCCAALVSSVASAAISWKRVGTVTTLTNGQLCTTDGTSVYCDSTTPTVSGGMVGIGSTLPLVSLDDSQNHDAIALPGGSNAQRPTGINLVNGEIRYNSGGSGTVEAYYNSSWNTLLTSGASGGAIPAAGSNWQVQFNNSGYLGANSSFVWDNTNGRVGIGTTAPGATFQVNQSSGDIARFVQGGTLRYSFLADAGSGTFLSYNAGTAGLENPSGALVFRTASGQTAGNGTERMRIDQTGNVGIGTTSPQSLLQVGSNSGSNSSSVSLTGDVRLPAYGSGIAYLSGEDTSGSNSINLQLGTQNAGTLINTMTLTSAGNVGIGTTAPSQKLEISGGNASLDTGWLIVQNSYGVMDANTNNQRIMVDQNNGIVFNTGSGSTNERMRITTSGNVGIGTTSPIDALHIYGSGSAASTIAIQNTANGGSSGYEGMNLYDSGGNLASSFSHSSSSATYLPSSTWIGTRNATDPFYIITGAVVPTPSVTVLASGNVGIGSTSPLDTLTVNGTVGYMLGSDLTTTGSQNNVAIGTSSALRYNGTAVATFTGIAAGANGQILYLHNPSAYTLTLSNQNASSSAANRIVTGTGADLPVPSNTSVTMQYDATASLWRVTGSSNAATSLPAGSNTQVQFNNAGAFGASSNFVWDNTNGRLGIGTATPGTTFGIYGNTGGYTDEMTITNAGGLGISGVAPDVLTLATLGSNSSVYGWLNSSGLIESQAANGLILSAYATGGITFQTGIRNTAMTINSSSNVGIGTTTPQNKLDTYGGIAVGTSYAGVDAAPTNGAIIQGNVGIGTASVPTGMSAAVNGPVKVAGSGSETCNASTVGAIRYNPTGNYFELCSYP